MGFVDSSPLVLAVDSEKMPLSVESVLLFKLDGPGGGAIVCLAPLAKGCVTGDFVDRESPSRIPATVVSSVSPSL